MAVNNYQQENMIWKITILEIMCTFCLHCFDEYCLSRFHYAQLFLGDGITFDHNHKINIVTLTTMYMYISEPLYIFKTLMSSFLRIFVLSPTPLKLVLHSYPEAPAIEKRVYKVFSIATIFYPNFHCLNWYTSL